MQKLPDKELLKIRLYGDGITPRTFKSQEVAQLLESLEKSLKAYILENNPEIEDSELFISPVGIEDKSLGILFSPNVAKYFSTAYVAVTTAISHGNLSSLPDKTVSHLHEVQKIIRAKNCNAEFAIGDNLLGSITPDTEIVVTKEIIKGETIIYGVVQWAGGAEPKAWVKVKDKQIGLEVTQSQAKILGKKLYEEVGFKGIAKWSKSKNTLVEFKVTSIIDSYDPKSLRQSFDEIHSIIGKYWDNQNDIDQTLLND